MHKCQQTFSAMEDGEPEVQQDFELNNQLNGGTIQGSVRITRVCCDCGTEVKEYTFDLEETIEIPEECAEHDLELDAESPEMTSRTQTTDRHGKPIKNSRYMKSFYGVEVAYTVTCKTCKKDIATGTIADETQASGMEDLE